MNINCIVVGTFLHDTIEDSNFNFSLLLKITACTASFAYLPIHPISQVDNTSGTIYSCLYIEV